MFTLVPNSGLETHFPEAPASRNIQSTRTPAHLHNKPPRPPSPTLRLLSSYTLSPLRFPVCEHPPKTHPPHRGNEWLVIPHLQYPPRFSPNPTISTITLEHSPDPPCSSRGPLPLYSIPLIANPAGCRRRRQVTYDSCINASRADLLRRVCGTRSNGVPMPV